MKNQFFTFAFLMSLTANAFAFNDKAFFDETNKEAQWKFIEKKFITEVGAAKQSWSEILNNITIGAIITGGIAGAYGYTHVNITPNNSEEKKDIIKVALEPHNAYKIISAAAGLYAVYKVYSSHTNHAVHCKVVADFFVNWEDNQYYVPDELFDGLNILAEMIEQQGDDFIATHADAIIETVQFFVKRHFEKRYEKSLQAEAAMSLGDIKTMTEIVKNSIESASKLSGQK